MEKRKVDWLILMICQLVTGYFMPKREGNCTLYLQWTLYAYIHILSVVVLSKLVYRSWRLPEGSFSKATAPRCRGGHYSFPCHCFTYSWSISYNAVKQGGIKCHFLSLWHDLTNSLTIMPMSWCLMIIIC